MFEKTSEVECVGEKEKQNIIVKEKTDVFERLMRTNKMKVENSSEKKKRKRVKSVEKIGTSLMDNWVLKGVDTGKKPRVEREVISTKKVEKRMEQEKGRSKVDIQLVKNVRKRFEKEIKDQPHFNSQTSSSVQHSGRKIVKEKDTKKIMNKNEQEAKFVKKRTDLDQKVKIWDKFYLKGSLDQKNGAENEKDGQKIKKVGTEEKNGQEIEQKKTLEFLRVPNSLGAKRAENLTTTTTKS